MLRTILFVLPVFVLPVLAAAETRAILPTRYFNSFDHRHEVLARIKPGDTVVTKTIDAGGYDEHAKKVGERSNPQTGPFFIEGAEAGDAIAVTFNRVRMNRDFGWSAYRLGLYSINPEQVEGLYANTRPRGAALPDRENLVRWDIDLARNTVKLRDPASKVHPMRFAAKPMLGCVGVAAPGVFAPTSGISGNYGGNMDYNRIGEGATVILPVFHPGALLFIGDGHALQADGEPTGTGVETSMDVTFTVALRKQARVNNPRVETADSIIAIGSQPEFVTSLDRSLRVATSEMVDWLVRDYKMEPWAAHLLIGYQGQYDVITVAGSMALRLPKSALPGGDVRADVRIDKPTAREIVITRGFAAPPERVFDALTNADQVPRWFTPSRMKLVSYEAAVQPGGAYRYVFERPNGRKLEMRGKFQEVLRPDRLVRTETYDFSPIQLLVTLEFEKTGAETLMRETIRYASKEEGDGDFDAVASSTAEIWPKLDAYLAN